MPFAILAPMPFGCFIWHFPPYYVIIPLVSKEDNLKTQGLSVLTEEQLQEFIRLLNKTGTKYKAVHTKDGDEIVLLKVSVTGVIPEVMKWLQGFGVDLIDWFQR